MIDVDIINEAAREHARAYYRRTGASREHFGELLCAIANAIESGHELTPADVDALAKALKDGEPWHV